MGLPAVLSITCLVNFLQLWRRHLDSDDFVNSLQQCFIFIIYSGVSLTKIWIWILNLFHHEKEDRKPSNSSDHSICNGMFPPLGPSLGRNKWSNVFNSWEKVNIIFLLQDQSLIFLHKQIYNLASTIIILRSKLKVYIDINTRPLQCIAIITAFLVSYFSFRYAVCSSIILF